MVYAAEIALKEIENDPESLEECNNYTAGVNAYIASLTESTLPFEYKLMGYYPEKWSNLKTALFLKNMALDLAGFENDFELTNARSVFSSADFNLIYPVVMDSLDPIVPKGTVFAKPGIDLEVPAIADHTVFIPQAPELLLPILEMVPLQLFAYYVAVKRGLDVDRPRNLVKSVTLE